MAVGSINSAKEPMSVDFRLRRCGDETTAIS